MSLRERFYKRVPHRPIDGCWVWRGCAPEEYGRLWDGAKLERAHRISYALHIGPVPDDMFVLHECDNPPCVNPSHLFLGTAGDNARDRAAKGRNGNSGRPCVSWDSLCKRGHPRAEYGRINAQGRMICLECKRELDRKRLADKRADRELFN